MLDLTLSILSSSLIFVVFKLYALYRVQTFFGIIVNYVVACVVGLLYFDGPVPWRDVSHKSWFPVTLFLGALFIIVFNLMARTSQKSGVSVASVATKMSLVIPVLLGVVLYGEQLGALNILGVLLALAAVYFTSVNDLGTGIGKRELLLPFLVFLGSGIIDSSIKFMEATLVPSSEFSLFSATIFGAAAGFGCLMVLFRSFRTPVRINYRNLLGGIALGIPNFFSIYFILRALQHASLNSASIFTINNVAIVMLSTLLGLVLFKEKIGVVNWVGIAMAVVSILLVALY